MDAVVAFINRPDIKAFLIMLVGLAVVILVVVLSKRTYNTTKSIAQQIKDAKTVLAQYDTTYGKRDSLETLLSTLVPDTCQTANFYVATASNCAMFGPAVGGTISADYIVSYLRAGARCLDMAIFPENPTNPAATPIVCEGDHTTRTRTTANYITFDEACSTIARYGLEHNGMTIDGLKNGDDPLFLHLRIRAGQNINMLTSIAATLKKYFDEYRLPYTYYKCGRQGQIYATNLKDFTGKIVIMTDTPMAGTAVDEYVNITFAPSRGAINALEQTEWTVADMTALDAPGVDHVRAASKQRLMYAAAGDSVARDLGIHFVGVDYSGMKPEKMFSKFSFAQKPAALRYVLPVITQPVAPGPAFDAKGGIIAVQGL